MGTASLRSARVWRGTRRARRDDPRAVALRGWSLLVALMLTGSAPAACVGAAAANATAEASVAATPWTGPAGVMRTTDDIMTAARRPEPHVARNHEAGVFWRPPDVERTHLNNPDNDDTQALLEFSTPPAPAGPADETPQMLGAGFTAATSDDTLYNPPSPSGAAGPAQFLLAFNRQIRVFEKYTGVVGALDADLDTFFDPVREGLNPVNPRVRFDRATQRWFVLASTVHGGTGYITGPNRLLLAVSDGPLITGATVWTLFGFYQNEVAPAGDSDCMSDHASLGLDHHALYIGVNQWCGIGTPGYYSGTVGFVIRKSSVLSGGPVVVSVFRNLTQGAHGAGPYAPQGVDSFDPGALDGYFIGVSNDSLGSLTLRRISDPGSTPTISPNIVLNTAGTAPPALVPHLGNQAGASGNLSAANDRLCASHIRNGRLWTAHNIMVNSAGRSAAPLSRVAVRWYELTNLAAAPYIAASGTIYDPAPVNPLNYWMPSLITSAQGRVAFGFSVAGNTSYVDAATTSLLIGEVLAAPFRLTTSMSAYNPVFDEGGLYGRRWGEISQTSIDPADDVSLWTVQQYTAGPGVWGLRVAQLLAPAPTLDPVTQHVCNTQPQQMLTITGAGFYDMGPGFTRPTLEFLEGGITTTELVVIDSQTLGVTIAVSPHVGWNSRSMLYTNPDGQSTVLWHGVRLYGGRADFNGDCRVDEADLLIFAACATGPGMHYDPFNLPPECNLPLTLSNHLPPDLDDDEDVDAADFGILQRCISGADHYIPDTSECRWGI